MQLLAADETGQRGNNLDHLVADEEACPQEHDQDQTGLLLTEDEDQLTGPELGREHQ